VLSANESTYPRRQRRALAVIVGVELEIQFEENGGARCLHRSSNDRTTLGRRWKGRREREAREVDVALFLPKALGIPQTGTPWLSPTALGPIETPMSHNVSQHKGKPALRSSRRVAGW
jgi:hypothetical protein